MGHYGLPKDFVAKIATNVARIAMLLKSNRNMERGRRIELLALAWKAKVLPLYEPRKY
jgi:hypothetical protein